PLEPARATLPGRQVELAMELHHGEGACPTCHLGQGWAGSIDAIRLDPVLEFVDAAGAPASGWFEIDSISLR
ncbi:MAG: hypothetical protein ABMA64_28145, partial [Myxococcota bacterium]